MRATLAAAGGCSDHAGDGRGAARANSGAKAGAAATFDGLDAAGRELLAEETIARAAEADVRTPVWQRIVGMIMRALRAVELWRGAMNDTGCEALLRAAAQGCGGRVRTGGCDGRADKTSVSAHVPATRCLLREGRPWRRRHRVRNALRPRRLPRCDLSARGHGGRNAGRKPMQAMIDRFHGIKIAQREAHPGGLSPEQKDGYISRPDPSIGGRGRGTARPVRRAGRTASAKIDGSKGLLEARAGASTDDQWLGWMVAQRLWR